MNDPYRLFRDQCSALIKRAVREPAGYVFEAPPRREMGTLACNVAFQLTRLRKNSPVAIASAIVKDFDLSAAPLVRDVQVAGPGFINFFVHEQAYSALVLGAIVENGDSFGRTTETSNRSVLIEHTSVNPNKPWHIGHARNAVLGDTLSRLFRFVGDIVEVQNYIDDTGKQVADMVTALRVYGGQDDPSVVPQTGDVKLDHYLGTLYARLYEELDKDTALTAEQSVLRQAIAEAATVTELVDKNASHNDLAMSDMDVQAVVELTKFEDGEQRVSSMSPSNYRLRLAEIQVERDAIAAMKADAEAVQHTLELGTYRSLVRACVHAQLQTAWRLGVYYDLLSWEQDIVHAGLLDEALALLSASSGVKIASFGKKAGCLVVDMGKAAVETEETDLDDEHSSEVVLVRSNGLPTYVGKDVAYHFWKYGLLEKDMGYTLDIVQPNGQELFTSYPDGQLRPHFKATDVLNIIASHQIYPQQVVAAALKATGHGDIDFHHLAYGMVSARVGDSDVSMSGRRGTGVSTDSVLDSAYEVALQRVKDKHEDSLTEDEMSRVAETIASASVRYVMVRYNPLTEIVLDPAEIVEFEGNTGAYLMYAYTRMVGILRRADEKGVAADALSIATKADALTEDVEVNLILALSRFPEVLQTTTHSLSVNLIAEYANEIATLFSGFYNLCPILNAQPALDPTVLAARLSLVRATAQVMKNVAQVLGITLVERL